MAFREGNTDRPDRQLRNLTRPRLATPGCWVYRQGMKIPRSLRADIRRTYSFGLVANLGMPGDAQARWSRFREAAKDLVTTDTLDALEAAWSATECNATEPTKVDTDAPVEGATFEIGDRVRIARPQPRPYRQAAPLGWEGRICNFLPGVTDPFWVVGEQGATGWRCSASELEHVSEPAPAVRPFKVGDRVRVIKSDLEEAVDQLEVGSEGDRRLRP